ncbi:MAG: DUF4295 domain-containing protein [Bacteroidales bacterium]|nr:DUF4295 domain-containing protein [Bacteroidales bacterium]
MAKKVVATLKTSANGKQVTKCIKMTKSGKGGSYQFKEEIVANDLVNEFFKK